MRHTRLVITSLSLLLVVAPGCASTSLFQDPGRLIGKPKFERRVSRILCIWEPSQGTGVDGKAARGFAGQVLFFGSKEESARVHGEVRIHEYENFDPDAEEQTPLHTFNFSPDAWDAHRSEGALGHSYSVFIPYMQKHKDAASVALLMEFVCADGRVVKSEVVNVLLPSRKATIESTVMRRGVVRESKKIPGRTSFVQPASFEDSDVSPDAETSHDTNAASKLDTMTIKLPPRRPTR